MQTDAGPTTNDGVVTTIVASVRQVLLKVHGICTNVASLLHDWDPGVIHRDPGTPAYYTG